ncbi:MAG: N-acetylmuramoyl-L-alanine amidase, partial [Nocardioides sp.]|nr:N-acetylmuramoyl-L-alanine amidase [Nocardioides sp.]
GPMNLTDVAATAPKTATEPDRLGKGDPATEHAPSRQQAQTTATSAGEVETLQTAHALTGIATQRLRRDPVANICGAAAVLANFQQDAGGADSLGDWSAAVARYSGAPDVATATRFVNEVYATLESGETRTTNDGERVTLAATPGAAPDRAAIAKAGLKAAPKADAAAQTFCPATLACEWIPAPYEQYGSGLGDYGNYDLADRPTTGSIDYIVIHDMDGTYDSSLKLVQDPTYLGWHYSIRSVDGHVADHMDPKNIGWHAGNWYVNTHSIGVEHEGFATQASWYTEAEYENSATLVRWLAKTYGVPLDRAHIIGHDQVPGITSGATASMHWDPGPYWDWSHYFDLLGAPIRPDRHGKSDVWTVKPAFAPNAANTMTGCDTAGEACPSDRSTNFVNVYTAPSLDAPLVKDAAMPSDRVVSNWGPRLAPGQKVVVDAKKDDGWWGIWFAGQQGWIHNPASAPVLLPASGQVVTPKGTTAIPVYGRAYPEQAAYAGTGITYQTISPLEYTIPAGQQYVLADATVPTDYYKASNYNCQSVGGVPDCVSVTGTKKYYEIWYNHRIVYVAADDVTVK